MSTQTLKARSLVPAVPRREALARKPWFETVLALFGVPDNVPDHLREDVGLPPAERSIFDFPLVDLGRDRASRNRDWMN